MEQTGCVTDCDLTTHVDLDLSLCTYNMKALNEISEVISGFERLCYAAD